MQLSQSLSEFWLSGFYGSICRKTTVHSHQHGYKNELMKFPESKTAHAYLDGLKGIEIGGSAHNPFGLDTINVDRIHHTSLEFEPYALEQVRLCGEVLPVDVVAPGDRLPFEDKSFDFVISSHVIEHFFDPIAALKEWARAARRYIFIIFPHRDALPSDVDKSLTSLYEHSARHAGLIEAMDTDEHHSRWTLSTFVHMCNAYGFHVERCDTNDDKVGNGCMVLIDVMRSEIGDTINDLYAEHPDVVAGL